MLLNLLDVTSRLNGMTVINHALLYFDEIGYNQSSGLVCDGIASDICCQNSNALGEGGKNGSLPNGIGSWITPGDTYVRRDCDGCTDILMDTFQVHRTENATVMYRNENPDELVDGIYRCVIPLSTNSSDGEPLIQYIGIFERGKGKLLLSKGAYCSNSLWCSYQHLINTPQEECLASKGWPCDTTT